MKTVEYDEKQMAAFRSWLLEQLRTRHWNRAELSRRTGISQGNIVKWLKAADNESFHRPSLDSAERLAFAFGISVNTVLKNMGLAGFRDDDLTDLQRDTIALIPLVGEDDLRSIYRQLRGLIDTKVQRQAREALGTPDAQEREYQPSTRGPLS